MNYCDTCEFIAEMDVTQLTACECNKELAGTLAPTATTKDWSLA